MAQVRKNSAAEDVSKSQFIIFDSCIVLFVDNVVIRENVLTPKWFFGVWSFSFPFCLVPFVQAGMLGRVVSNWVSIIDLGVVLQPIFTPDALLY